MKLALISAVGLASAVLSAPAMAQQNGQLTPVTAEELDGFVGVTLRGRAFAPLGTVSETDADQGTIMIVGRHGEVATIPAMLLGRYGAQLRAPAVSIGEVAQASFGGKSKVPLTGSVQITDVEEPASDVSVAQAGR